MNEIITVNEEPVAKMREIGTYKYLDFKQNVTIDRSEIKKELTTQYKNRLNQILISKLNRKSTFKAINTYAVTAFSYSVGVIDWTNTNLGELNRITRTSMTKFRKHYPKVCSERLYSPRGKHERGLIDLKYLSAGQITKRVEYFNHKNDGPLHKAIIKADKSYTLLNLCRNRTQVTKIHNLDSYPMEIRSTKALHGKHINILKKENIHKLRTSSWPKEGLINPETKGFAIVVQVQVTNPRCYWKYICKHTTTTVKYRKETIDLITYGCKMVAAFEYTNRHNNVCKIIDLTLLNQKKMRTSSELIIENDTYKIYCDNLILTDQTIVAKCLDITLIDKKK